MPYLICNFTMVHKHTIEEMDSACGKTTIRIYIELFGVWTASKLLSTCIFNTQFCAYRKVLSTVVQQRSDIKDWDSYRIKIWERRTSRNRESAKDERERHFQGCSLSRQSSSYLVCCLVCLLHSIRYRHLSSM